MEKMFRDFTYIDDEVNSIESCCDKPTIINKNFAFLDPKPAVSFAPHMIFNLGSSKLVSLLGFIEKLEKEFQFKAIKDLKHIQPSDAEKTYADIEKIKNWCNNTPKINFDDGIHNFAN